MNILHNTIEELNSAMQWFLSNDLYVNHGTSDTTFTLPPRQLHVWGEVASLTITLAEGEDGMTNEYKFSFTSGATPTTLSLPTGLKFPKEKGGLTIQANTIYEVSIQRGLVSWSGFSNA